jgi:hypothetical protein
VYGELCRSEGPKDATVTTGVAKRNPGDAAAGTVGTERQSVRIAREFAVWTACVFELRRDRQGRSSNRRRLAASPMQVRNALGDLA